MPAEALLGRLTRFTVCHERDAPLERVVAPVGPEAVIVSSARAVALVSHAHAVDAMRHAVAIAEPSTSITDTCCGRADAIVAMDAVFGPTSAQGWIGARGEIAVGILSCALTSAGAGLAELAARSAGEIHWPMSENANTRRAVRYTGVRRRTFRAVSACSADGCGAFE